MKVVGLVTEYNPFHNGHKYHIEEAKRVTGADYVVAIMSGNFVQRGTPALIDKYSRTEMALHNGVDLVLELPVCYATGSAEYFAHGAISILDKLGIVDALCFGSECGDITLLGEAAQFLSDTPDDFDKQLQSFLKDGLTYPAARIKALEQSIGNIEDFDGQAIARVLTQPNNILGIEYMKALKTFSSSMVPVTIQRKSAHYHDKELGAATSVNELDEVDTEVADEVISSATAIRNAIHARSSNAGVFEPMKQSVPADVYRILKEQHLKSYPITEEDFSSIIKYKLLSEDKQTLSEYLDISGDLADRLKNITDHNRSISVLIQEIKTKNITLTRINRALIHILLGIRTLTMTEYISGGYAYYARVLGIKKESSHLLRQIEAKEGIPIITKVSKANALLDHLGARMLSEDLFAAHLYNQAVYEKYKTMLLNEYKHGIVML